MLFSQTFLLSQQFSSLGLESKDCRPATSNGEGQFILKLADLKAEAITGAFKLLDAILTLSDNELTTLSLSLRD
jgi:hypothetical protein